MKNFPSPEREKNLANELAKERNRAAAERTLMAWIRTSLSLISFGVGIEGIVNAIYTTTGGKGTPVGITRLAGLAFVVLGTVAIVAATIEHRQILERIERGDFTRKSNISLGLIIAYGLCSIGLLALIGIMTRLFFD